MVVYDILNCSSGFKLLFFNFFVNYPDAQLLDIT